MKLTKEHFQRMLDSLMAIEIKSVGDVIKKYEKEGVKELNEHKMMAHSYLKGLRRAQTIISIVLKDTP